MFTQRGEERVLQGTRPASSERIRADVASSVSVLLLEVVPQAMRALRKEMRACRDGALTVPQFRILAFLWREPAGTKLLAEQLGVSQAAISRMLKGLEDRGLVERTPGTSDKRQSTAHLTRKGQKHFEQVRSATRTRLAAVLQGVEESRLERVGEGLLELHEVLTSQFSARF